MRNLIALVVMLAFLGFVAWGTGWSLHAFADSVASTPTPAPTVTTAATVTAMFTPTPMPTVLPTATWVPTSTPAW